VRTTSTGTAPAKPRTFAPATILFRESIEVRYYAFSVDIPPCRAARIVHSARIVASPPERTWPQGRYEPPNCRPLDP
jgi:hypothetical protein